MSSGPIAIPGSPARPSPSRQSSKDSLESLEEGEEGISLCNKLMLLFKRYLQVFQKITIFL